MIYTCSVQKTALKDTKYSRNETILKMDHLAKARQSCLVQKMAPKNT